MRVQALLVFLAVLFCVAASHITRYDNDHLLKVNITTPEQRDRLASWIEKVNAQSPHFETPPLDVWSFGSNIALGTNDIHVNNTFLSQFQTFLSGSSIPHSVAHSNIQQLIDSEHDIPVDKQASWFDAYHGFDAIVFEVKRLCDLNPSLCTYVPEVAKTIQGQSVVGVHLQGLQADDDAPVVWLQGGQHAREWVSPATVMYILSQFVELYGTDPTVTDLLDKTRIIIVPLCNPDGYSYTWTNTRLWRKNRRLNSGGTYGVDLNRNWADHWGGPGSSGVPSSDTYRGTAPFSEPESSGVSKYLLKHATNAIVAIDYHSYSQLVLRPFSWGTTQPSNNAQQVAGGNGIVTAIRGTTGVEYTNIAGYELYVASGGAHDWFYTEGKATLAYTIELRDTGRYGFQLPASQIIPTGRENWAALIWLIDYALKL